MKNPIIDNRIVNDNTFAIRLKSFVERTDVNNPMSEEEKEYLLMVADKLLSWQCRTANTGEEINYLKNCCKEKYDSEVDEGGTMTEMDYEKLLEIFHKMIWKSMEKRVKLNIEL